MLKSKTLKMPEPTEAAKETAKQIASDLKKEAEKVKKDNLKFYE